MCLNCYRRGLGGGGGGGEGRGDWGGGGRAGLSSRTVQQ